MSFLEKFDKELVGQGDLWGGNEIIIQKYPGGSAFIWILVKNFRLLSAK